MLNPPNPLMIELKYGRFGLFLAHMHSRYHESSKTHKKIVLRQRCSKKLHFVTRNNINAHLKGLFFIISFRNRKKIRFTILKVLNPLILFEVVFWRTHGIDCAYEPKRAQNDHISTQSWANLEGSKRWNAFSSFFKLSYGKKPFECSSWKLRERKCG